MRAFLYTFGLSTLLLSSLAYADDAPPSSPLYWTDSYSVDGQCYCDTTFDHELTDITVDTPLGLLPVSQVCADISARLGQGSTSGRLYYNTVHCGHAPANTAADEIDCPGFLTDSSGAIQNYGCAASGARWNLASLYGSADDVPFMANPFTLIDSDSDLPQCVNAASDADGDGYGWEQGRSCSVRELSQQSSGDDGVPARVIAGGGSVSGFATTLLLTFAVVRRLRRPGRICDGVRSTVVDNARTQKSCESPLTISIYS